MQLMHARGRGTSPKLRVFVDFVTALFKDPGPGAIEAARVARPQKWPMFRA
jgi:hypothetical protein